MLDYKYLGSPPKQDLRKRAKMGTVWVCGRLYASTDDNVDSLSPGSEVSWKWAVSDVNCRPREGLELSMVNETTGRTMLVMVTSVPPAVAMDSKNIKKTRRASGIMATVALAKPTVVMNLNPVSRTSMVFSKKQRDAFIRI